MKNYGIATVECDTIRCFPGNRHSKVTV